jgi:hypothetical protein
MIQLKESIEKQILKCLSSPSVKLVERTIRKYHIDPCWALNSASSIEVFDFILSMGIKNWENDENVLFSVMLKNNVELLQHVFNRCRFKISNKTISSAWRDIYHLKHIDPTMKVLIKQYQKKRGEYIVRKEAERVKSAKEMAK